ncbi:MAG: hypothetical protein HY543_01145 [Deltaproteobacteria bacterium]|nr:hypothetical protein [Deltaproteobacteria bacterium]
MTDRFRNLCILGRPASGKSEFIDFMKQTAVPDRLAKYHIGAFEELDDFPWIWEKFMEDDLWEAAGYPRRYSFGGSNPGMHAEGGVLFDFCMQKFNHEYVTRYRANAAFYQAGTLFVEFARGGDEAYATSLAQLHPDLLRDAAILFILVSYEESCRRNDARYEEKMRHSILAHKVPDATMQHFYRTHDWLTLTQDRPDGYVPVGSIDVPFVTMQNEPELTDPALLNRRYGAALRRLMELTACRPSQR